MANRNASRRSYQYDRDYNRDYDYYSSGYGDQSYYGNPEFRSDSGQYAGYGPSGYTRADERIIDDINDRLTWNGQLDATGIKVDVHGGIVTLTGSVDTRRDKRLAEDIADGVPGVWDVNNQLQLRTQRGQPANTGTTRDQIHPGMEVVGSDDQPVGQVIDMGLNDFMVARSDASDVYIPFSACHVDQGRVRLNVTAGEVDSQGWDKVPEKSPARRHR